MKYRIIVELDDNYSIGFLEEYLAIICNSYEINSIKEECKFKVGDKVFVIKPDVYKEEDGDEWVKDMDKFDGEICEIKELERIERGTSIYLLVEDEDYWGFSQNWLKHSTSNPKSTILNRHETPLPSEPCEIEILYKDVEGETWIKCDWSPVESNVIHGEGYLGTARRQEIPSIGFHAWEQNNSEFVKYRLV